MCVSSVGVALPGQVFGHGVIGAGDEGCRVSPGGIRFGRHGERTQSHSPQQREHQRTQNHRLRTQQPFICFPINVSSTRDLEGKNSAVDKH